MRPSAPNAGQMTLVFLENTRHRREIQSATALVATATTAGGHYNHQKKSWTRQSLSNSRAGNHLKAAGAK
jgi:hypothetical protein